MADSSHWARVRDEVSASLRRGAWCPVVAITPERATLDAGGRRVTMARSSLIITTSRPTRWSIVSRPSDAVNMPARWGEHYAVCPACSHRAALGDPTTDKRCSRCGGMFAINDEP